MMIGYRLRRLESATARENDYIVLKFNNYNTSGYPQRFAAASLKLSRLLQRSRDTIAVIRSEPPSYSQVA